MEDMGHNSVELSVLDCALNFLEAKLTSIVSNSNEMKCKYSCCLVDKSDEYS